MKTVIITCLFLICLSGTIQAATFWNYYRHSGNISDNTNQYAVQIRVNATDADTSGFTAEYRANNAVQIIPMLQISEYPPYVDPFFKSYMATLQLADPNRVQIGFRHHESGALKLAPVKFDGTQPNWEQMSAGNTDPIGDAAFTTPSLDITDWRITYDDANLYIALKNNSNAYPVSSGFTFYSYMGGIINPADSSANPLVYALLYTINQAGIISPGLYKITGTGISDMQRLGAITVLNPAGSNILYLTCSWADLQADADFSAWFNTSGCFAFTTLTQKITLTGGIVQADEAEGATIYLSNEEYEFVDNHIPVISNLQMHAVLPDPEPGNMFMEISYSDADGDIPINATIEFDTGENWEWYSHDSFDFSFPVMYRNNDIPATFFYSGSWQTMAIKFWYTNESYVDTVYTNTGIHDPIVPVSQLNCTVYPNPFSTYVNICIDNPKRETAEISIYNIRGQLVQKLHEGMLDKGMQNYTWNVNGTDNASGVYFLRISTEDKVVTRKMAVVK